MILLVSSGIDASDDGEPATWVSVLKLVLGAAAARSGRQAVARARNDEKPAPKWMQAIDHFGPGKALGIGVLLAAVNPKNLLLTIGAAAAIAQTGIEFGSSRRLALAVFIVIGTIGVGAPIVIYFALGERSKDILDGLKSWMAANNAVIMAVLLLVIGAKLLGDGICGL